MALDRNKVQEFRRDFDVTARLFEAKYGLKLNLGTIRFDATSLRCTLNGLLSDPFGESAKNVTAMPPATVSPILQSGDGPGNYVRTQAEAAGFKIESSPKGFIGSKYRIPGKRLIYTVTGVNAHAPKYCVLVKTETGTQYRMPVSMFRTAVLVGHD